jgi:tyrosine-protein kinase Etk/Wzc
MAENELIQDYKSDDEINFLDLILILLTHKKFILSFTFSCALITVIISLLITPTFKAETKILPPQTSNSSFATQLLGKIGSATGLINSSFGVTNQNSVYVSMLKSRSMFDFIIDKFALMEVFNIEQKEVARQIFNNSVSVQMEEDSNIISLSVLDKDPKRAADIANAFIEKLKEMNNTFAITEASKQKLFFEEQLVKVKENLLKSEEAMKELQEKTGAINIDSQALAVIESVAGLRAQISAKEIEIKVMKTYLEPKNPDFQKATDTLQGMNEELKKLEAKNLINADPIVPTGNLPQVGADYARKLRELKYQETLFELIASQYEIARIDEARDSTIIQVLDKAITPEIKYKPKRTLLVISATLLSFLISCLIAFYKDYITRISRDPNKKNTIQLIKSNFFLKKNF